MIHNHRVRTASEWFEACHLAYVVGHQGCARCGGQHCVFRSRWGRRLEYQCTECDFSASRDEQTGQTSASVGEPARLAPSLLAPERYESARN